MIQYISKKASTRTKLVMCFNNSRSWSEDLTSKINLSPIPPLVASAAVRSRLVVLLLFNLFFYCCPIVCEFFCVRFLFCYAVLCVLSRFNWGKRSWLVFFNFLLMPCGCCRTLPIPSGAMGGLQFVIFALLGHSHLLFYAFVCCFWISTFNSNSLIIHGKHKIVIRISFLQ